MGSYPGKTPGTRRIVFYSEGRRYERVISGGKAEAAEYEARWRGELRGSETADPRRVPLFNEFCEDRYRPHARMHLKASTWGQVRKYQIATLIRLLSSFRIDELAAIEPIDEYKAARAREKWRGKTIKASSINNELRVLRTVLAHAKALGYAIPLIKWKRLPARGKPRATAWSEPELQRIFAAARAVAPGLLDMFVFLVNTGCRKGEAIVSEHSWIDVRAGLVRIPSNEAWQPKNGLPREVPISDALRAVVCRPHAHPTYLFPNRLGGRYARFPKDLFRDVIDLAAVAGTPHQFRHTFASHFLAAQPDMFLLAQVMGHSHARVTELYSHMLPGHLARARNAVNIAPAQENLGSDLGRASKKR